MTVYLVLTFALAWALWFAAGITSSDGPPNTPLFLLGVFAPGIVSLLLTARAGGRDAVVALLKRLVDWKVPARWFVFALFYMFTIKLAVAVLYRAAWGSWPVFGSDAVPLMFAGAIASTMMGGQAGEELGWRGYALPRLADRFGLGPAGIVLGVIWAAWHLPLFFAPAGDTFGQSFPLYLLQVVAVSVAMAWVYGNVRGSLLPLMLLHAAINNTKGIVPSADAGATDVWMLSRSPVAWLTVLLLWVGAAYFLYDMRGRVGIHSRHAGPTPQ